MLTPPAQNNRKTMIFSLVTLPDASTFLTAVGAWSAPIITDLFPLVYWAVGIILAFAIPGLIISWISHAVSRSKN